MSSPLLPPSPKRLTGEDISDSKKLIENISKGTLQEIGAVVRTFIDVLAINHDIARTKNMSSLKRSLRKKPSRP